MKFLKYLLGFLLLICLIFFGRGLLTPSVSYESEIEVNKSALESWSVMSDETKLSQWLNGFQKSELVSGTANTVGAISNIYFLEDGQETVIKETVTKVIPNEVLAMNFDIEFMNMDYELTMNEADGKTKIVSKTTAKGNGLFAKSMVSFMTGAMKSQEDENLLNLKKLIDENTTNYFPDVEVEAELPEVETAQ